MRVKLIESPLQVIKVGVKFVGLQYSPGKPLLTLLTLPSLLKLPTGEVSSMRYDGVVNGTPFVEQYVISKALTPSGSFSSPKLLTEKRKKQKRNAS